MTLTEKLIESIVYANGEGTDWWDEFDSLREAGRAVRYALHESNPDEYFMVTVISVVPEAEEASDQGPLKAYRTGLKALLDKMNESQHKNSD